MNIKTLTGGAVIIAAAAAVSVAALRSGEPKESIVNKQAGCIADSAVRLKKAPSGYKFGPRGVLITVSPVASVADRKP